MISTENSSTNRRMYILSACQSNIIYLLTKMRMRVWHCLIPSVNYPLSDCDSSVLLGCDPKSLMARSFFTPSEDDLLIRGLITYGENSWPKIRKN